MKKVLFVIIPLILFISLFLGLSRNPKVFNTQNTLAIYIKENGEYIPYKGNDFKIDGYHLNYNDTVCYDKENKVLENTTDYLEETTTGIRLKSDITISCKLYFTNDDNVSSKFYLKEVGNNKYTNTLKNNYYLKLEETLTSYCLTEETNESSCIWQNINNQEINGSYEFQNNNYGLKEVSIYVKDATENSILYAKDSIYYDNISPLCGDITINDSAQELVSGTVTCLDKESGCVSDLISFSDISLNTEVKIQDLAGNENSCLIK